MTMQSKFRAGGARPRLILGIMNVGGGSRPAPTIPDDCRKFFLI